jgi:type IV pilus assembly protein PilB
VTDHSRGNRGKDDKYEFLARQFGVPFVNLSDFNVAPEIARLISKSVARKHLLIPLNIAGPSLIVAMANPSDIAAIDDARMMTGYNIEPVVATKAAIEEAIERFYKPLQN